MSESTSLVELNTLIRSFGIIIIHFCSNSRYKSSHSGSIANFLVILSLLVKSLQNGVTSLNALSSSILSIAA